MSILKRKATLAHQKFAKTHCLEELESEEITQEDEFRHPYLLTDQKSKIWSKHEPRQNLTLKTSKCSNNIMKNYSRALINFAISQTAKLERNFALERENLDELDFLKFIEHEKRKVNCIKNLRQKLLIKADDSELTTKCKRAFQELCVVFLKTFSVNWIFNSKISDRKTHLMYRFKILRRVRRPEWFTYLEDQKRQIV